jgi:hypothetical protein
MLNEQRRTDWIARLTALSVLAGVALRVALMARFASPLNPELWEFGKIATNLVRTGVYAFHTPGVPSAYMPPGYPLLIAALYATLGIGKLAHLALAVLLLAFEVAIPFLIAHLARLIWGARAGRIALLLALFWPQFLLLSGRLHSLPISMATLLLALVVLWGRPLSLGRAALCGLLIGIYGLFRMELAALAPVLLYAVLALVEPLRATIGRRVAALCVLGAVAALVVSPWLIRNFLVFDRVLVGTSGGYNLLRGHNEQATGAGRGIYSGSSEDSTQEIPERVRLSAPDFTSLEDELVFDAFCRKEALGFARSHPRREIELIFRKAFYFLIADFTHPVQRLWPVWVPSLAALLVGIAFWLKSGRGDARQNTLWMFFAINLALALVFFVLPRYRIAVEFVPLLFLAAWIDSRWGARILPSDPAPGAG